MSLATTENNSNDTVRTLTGGLPSLTANAARLARLVTDMRLTQRLARLAQVHELQSVPLANTHLAAADWGLLSVQHPAGQAHISFDLTPWPALQMLAADNSFNAVNAATSDADSTLYLAALETFLSPVAQRLTHFGLDSFEFRHLNLVAHDKKAVSANARQERVSLRFKLAESTQDEPCLLTINQIDTSLLEHLEALLVDEGVSALERWAQLKVPGRALLGIQRLEISTLYSLREGDLLLNGIAPHYRSLLDGSTLDTIELMWGTPNAKRLRSTGRLEGQTIVIKETPVISEDFDPEEAEASVSDDAALDNLAQLEVPVRLEVDTVMLPLAQLSALNPGYVIELPMPLAQANIRLTIHGQTIGFGELVAVGDHLAVRIKKMAPIDASTH